ncbi:hypothetical protein COOONC_16689, partial [Cooperia oncophora]
MYDVVMTRYTPRAFPIAKQPVEEYKSAPCRPRCASQVVSVRMVTDVTGMEIVCCQSSAIKTLDVNVMKPGANVRRVNENVLLQLRYMYNVVMTRYTPRAFPIAKQPAEEYKREGTSKQRFLSSGWFRQARRSENFQCTVQATMCKPGCICKDGYRRNGHGNCVLPKQCYK